MATTKRMWLIKISPECQYRENRVAKNIPIYNRGQPVQYWSIPVKLRNRNRMRFQAVPLVNIPDNRNRNGFAVAIHAPDSQTAPACIKFFTSNFIFHVALDEKTVSTQQLLTCWLNINCFMSMRTYFYKPVYFTIGDAGCQRWNGSVRKK